MTENFEQISNKPGFMKHNGGILFKNISLYSNTSGIKNIARDTWKYETKGEFRRLTTPEKIIGEQGQTGFFNVDDYVITPGGKTDKFLQRIRKESGKAAADEFETVIKNMRATVDNLTGKI